MPNQYLFGIDIGTYSSKGVLVEDETGIVIAEDSIEHGIEMPKPGWVRHAVDVIWWGEFVQISRALIDKSSVAPKSIISVGISALGARALPVGSDGRTLRKAVLYGIDTRVEAEIEELEKVFTPEKIFRISQSLDRFIHYDKIVPLFMGRCPVKWDKTHGRKEPIIRTLSRDPGLLYA